MAVFQFVLLLPALTPVSAIVLPQSLNNRSPETISHEDSRWSKEAILTLVGVYVAVAGITITVWLDPRGGCAGSTFLGSFDDTLYSLLSFVGFLTFL